MSASLEQKVLRANHAMREAQAKFRPQPYDTVKGAGVTGQVFAVEGDAALIAFAGDRQWLPVSVLTVTHRPIKQEGDLWRCESDTAPGISYTLRKVGDYATCNCPGFAFHGHCKHALRVEVVMDHEARMSVTTPTEPTDPEPSEAAFQQWQREALGEDDPMFRLIAA